MGSVSGGRPRGSASLPLLAVLAIATSIALTTWFLSDYHGYLLSGSALCLIILYGVLFTDRRISIDTGFLVLFGGYWFGLLAHYLVLPNPNLLEYVLVTPVAVVATVVVLPRLIESRRQAFAMGLTLLSVAVMLISVWMLWRTHTAGVEYPRSSRVGEEVMGLYAVRMASVFANPNTYGFFMMVGNLAALYTVLARGGAVWIGALGLCLLGLFMSEGDAAILGFGVGAVVLRSGRHRLLGFVGIVGAVVGTYALIRIGHFSEMMETTLMSRVDRWVLSLERLTLDPLWGIEFVDASEAISGSSGPHNSYLEVLLHTGVIAGGLYLGALVYALASGIRRRWTPWTGYVVGTAVGLLTFMTFESLLLGGLSTSSVVLGLIVGLMLLPAERSTTTSGVTAADSSSTAKRMPSDRDAGATSQTD